MSKVGNAGYGIRYDNASRMVNNGRMAKSDLSSDQRAKINDAAVRLSKGLEQKEEVLKFELVAKQQLAMVEKLSKKCQTLLTETLPQAIGKFENADRDHAADERATTHAQAVRDAANDENTEAVDLLHAARTAVNDAENALRAAGGAAGADLVATVNAARALVARLGPLAAAAAIKLADAETLLANATRASAVTVNARQGAAVQDINNSLREINAHIRVASNFLGKNIFAASGAAAANKLTLNGAIYNSNHLSDLEADATIFTIGAGFADCGNTVEAIQQYMGKIEGFKTRLDTAVNSINTKVLKSEAFETAVESIDNEIKDAVSVEGNICENIDVDELMAIMAKTENETATRTQFLLSRITRFRRSVEDMIRAGGR